MDRRRLNLGDIEISIAEAGVGQRPFLLLHGFTGAKEDFTDWLDPLAGAGWHAVAPDLRGHGASSKPASEDAYSFEILAHDALRLLDALGWERAALLGHSMGGMVAQFVAHEAPERLDALVLMDTDHGPIQGLDPQLVDAAVSIVRDRGMESLAEIMAGVESPLDSPAHQRALADRPGHAEFEDRKFRSTSPALYAAMAPRFAGTGDRLEELEALPPSLPALVIVGEQDGPLVGSSERMAAAIPGGSLAVIPDAGHSPQFENPDAWWRTLSAFLESVETAIA
ncbi:MAG TPA: alpha/beta hydrolase [Acidimicrobiales bacterium]|nr:alpha/beta hydrolase [Acidimicrobiales bacterium]